ncbi:hypothetical protein IWW55_005773 [Coemansia sp. RSA 2706]|nr:hypothetical protein IWW55_005773 [Coemansia sp. RSA 2706]
MLAHPARPLYFDGTGSTVRAIGSKTRPKHLTLHFHTSEGAAVKEQYIFKGNEDLRIDESVMQTFVRLNRVMGSRSQRGAAELSQPPAGSTLAVYNVVPTGAHGGMIQVVDSALSLFAMYSQHSAQHTSESAASVAHKRSMGDAGVPVSNHAAPPGLRQLFADHGQRILAASGLPSTLPFEKWPQVVAEQVFASLRATALPSLLHRQLMRAAPSSAHLLISTRRLVSSIGTASAAGYVVGLGDRHLDNLLVDLNTAQLVHIDFNVCYDFGGVSQIPEQVPFRMTPILAYLCGSPHPDQLANTPVAMSRGFANSFAALLQLARMDRCALVGAITARCLFSPFMEWCWIEEQRLQDKQQRIRTPTAQLPLPQCLCADAGLLANLESASAEEYIQATGLCPPQAFWSHDGMLREQSLTEAPSGWRLARGAVDRMRARLSFSGSLVGSQTEQVQLQTRALWEAATATPRLARMFAGWAPWV